MSLQARDRKWRRRQAQSGIQEGGPREGAARKPCCGPVSMRGPLPRSSHEAGLSLKSVGTAVGWGLGCLVRPRGPACLEEAVRPAGPRFSVSWGFGLGLGRS